VINLFFDSLQEIDDILNGSVSLVKGRLEFAVWPVRGIGTMVEPAVGQRTAEAFVEEQK
jgi:hypothetical protein